MSDVRCESFIDEDGDRADFRLSDDGISSVIVTADGYRPLEAYLTRDDLVTLRDALDEVLGGKEDASPFRLGEKVRVTGPLVWGNGTACNGNPYPGREGVVCRTIDEGGDVRVEFDEDPDIRAFIAATSVTRVDEAPTAGTVTVLVKPTLDADALAQITEDVRAAVRAAIT